MTSPGTGFTYWMNGNLSHRSRVGAISYPAGTAARPHAPTAIAGQAVTHDANGNMTNDGGGESAAVRG